MKRCLMVFCSLMFVMLAYAQSGQKEINDIKKSKRYVYAMAASMKSGEEAIASAKDLLLLEVEQWLKDEKMEDVAGYIVKVKNNTSQIETQRGKLYRAFVYVAKKDVLPYYKDEEIEMVKTDTLQTIPQPSPIVAEPKVEQPETPKVTLTVAEEEMLQINQFADINTYVAEKKADGTIVDYGKYATMPNDANIYIFVYNKQGEVCAKIKKVGDESLNMSTLQNDEVASYKGCGAIWIKMKE